ncbi:MAG: ethanolamine utilization protein EutH [Eubacterium sp.]|nr:ethanolamine utilization protein EutH [Eubacterium sp.]
MNPIVIFMLLFAAIGFIDRTFDLKLGTAEHFMTGFSMIPTMLISSVGVSSIGVMLIRNHLIAIQKALSSLPFNSGVILGAILAPDLGGLPICSQLSDQPGIILMNGVILSSILGQTVSFQIPVFLASLKKDYHDRIIRGFIMGIAMVPAGFLMAGLIAILMTGLSAKDFFREFIPVFLFCGFLMLGLIKKTELTVKIVHRAALLVQWVIFAMFFFTMLGVFFPRFAFVDASFAAENAFSIVKSCTIAGGALVLSDLVLKFFPGPIRWLSAKLGVNESSVLGLLLGMANSLAFLPIFHKMDDKGKIMNCAFSVSGAYLIGGQLGYISSLTDSRSVTVYLLAKAVCGILSVVLVSRISVNDPAS